MLRAVAFQNFIKFRRHQSLTFDNGPYFIVGPNGSGKTAIFELVRRCLSITANDSFSSVPDVDSPAFVMCKFSKIPDYVPAGSDVYSCVYIPSKNPKKLVKSSEKNPSELAESSEDLQIKFVYFFDKKQKQGKCYLDHYFTVKVDDKTETKKKSFRNESVTLSEELKGLIHDGLKQDGLIQGNRSLGNLDKMIAKIKGDPQQPEMQPKSADNKCETVLQAIHDAVVVTFPLRSPGPIQWSHSKTIGTKNKNYDMASNNAEILQELMESKDVDQIESDKIFKMIIHPLYYHFNRAPNASSITANDGEKDIQLLKVPVGIIEAKQFSLMFAHRKYKTLLLEEPDRGMHPHMIHKLRDLVLRTRSEDQEKVVLLTTHQTTMINQWSMSRMFICRRMQKVGGILEHCVIKLRNVIEQIFELEDILKEMVFSESVLFVEGFTDKRVIRSVFDRVLESNDMDGFYDMTARTQIISIGGRRKDIIDQLLKVGKDLNIPCVVLFDRDDLKAKVHPANPGQKWKNKVSRCARTLFKRENRNVKERNESPNEHNSLEKVMKVTVDGSDTELKEELCYTEGDLKEPDIDNVVHFIRSVVLPLPEKAVENNQENTYTWESGNLEEVICASILGDQTDVQQSNESSSIQTDINVDLLRRMFLCECYDDTKGKHPVKETLKQMNIKTARDLSLCLLKRGEMTTFLEFLSDRVIGFERLSGLFRSWKLSCIFYIHDFENTAL